MESAWKVFVVEGLVLVLLGAAAVIVPQIAGIAVTLVVGALLVAAGVVQLSRLVTARGTEGRWPTAILGLALAVLGGLFLYAPQSGALTLTALLAAFLIVEGVLEIGVAAAIRRHRGWLFLLVSGLAGVALGVAVIALMPRAAPLVIGVLVGVNLGLSGAALIALGVGLRRMLRVVRPPETAAAGAAASEPDGPASIFIEVDEDEDEAEAEAVSGGPDGSAR